MKKETYKQTAVEWLYERLERMIPRTALYNIDKEEYFDKAKEMEHQQQVDLLKFSKEMCTPEAPIDYIIKEFNKYGK